MKKRNRFGRGGAHGRKVSQWRLYVVWAILGVALLGLCFRLFQLCVLDRSFLRKQSQARILRTVEISAYRGMIADRLGKPLAISTPMDSVWMAPKAFEGDLVSIQKLAELLKTTPSRLHRLLKQKRQFVYLQRRVAPEIVKGIRALKIPGVYFQREYKRYYPEREVTAHVVGLTNVDDSGQEGLELAFDRWLSGKPGKKEVLKDRMGHVISDVALLKKPVQGKNLSVSLDHRIQYLAYRYLKEAVGHYHAKSGSVVVMDVSTGEILAMVNAPTYNPNSRQKKHDDRYRNRAVTDMFEPGSTIKPFNIALALQSGQYAPETMINTDPGRLKVGGYVIQDHGKNYGRINLTEVLQKSSNIGAAKIMLSLQPQSYWDLLRRFGFGERTSSGFPGESAGSLTPKRVWYPSVIATLAYGYGIAVTNLQLAHAYSILAAGGVDHGVTFLKQDPTDSDNTIKHTRVLNSKVAHEVLAMLETVAQKGGTGRRANVKGYRIAGKTGTAYIAGPHGYDKHRYIASFVGIAPLNHPRFVVAVVIRDPKGRHYGGVVAAPVFSKVMSGLLHLFNVIPEATPNLI